MDVKIKELRLAAATADGDNDASPVAGGEVAEVTLDSSLTKPTANALDAASGLAQNRQHSKHRKSPAKILQIAPYNLALGSPDVHCCDPGYPWPTAERSIEAPWCLFVLF